MNAITLEHLTPHVISGGYKRVIMPKPSSTSITPYKGCFVRYRYKNGGTPTLDTILLSNGIAWSYHETVDSDRFNNRPFGILDNRPAETDTAKDATAGKWAVIVFDTEDAPIRVAFRVTNDNYILEPATKDMLGKRFKIYGVSTTTSEGTFILPFALLSTDGTGLLCRQVYPAVYDEEEHVKEYGWVVLDLFVATQASQASDEDASKFLSFPYVYPLVQS